MESAIKVDNYTFHFLAAGCASNPTVLFLHGFMGNRHEFDQVIDVLSRRFYCLAIDLPGHGDTEVEADQNYIMQSTANGLICFLEALNIKQCALVGYSMGGRLALYLVLHFPQYFVKGILESSSPGLKIEQERANRRQSDMKLLKELKNGDFLSFLTNWYNQPLFASTKLHPNFDDMVAKRLNNNPLNLSKSLFHLSIGQQPSLWHELQNNKIPLLLLTGELDQKFVVISSEMANLCKYIKPVVVKNCGHNIHFECPEVFTRLAAIYLLSQPAQI